MDGITISCAACSRPFIVGRRKKFCSNACGSTYKEQHRHRVYVSKARPHEVITCVVCGVAIEAYNSRQRFCSRVCKGKYQNENYSTAYLSEKTLRSRSRDYKRYLQSLLHKTKGGLKDRTNITIEKLCALYEKQKGLCALSGRPMTHTLGKGRVKTNLSIDRINSSLGYTDDNIQLVCTTVNVMKSDNSVEDFVDWCKDIIKTNETRNEVL